MKIWEPLYELEEADWIILGIPFSDHVTAKKGSEKAPNAIRKLMNNTWTYDLKTRKDLFDEKIVDLGNIKCSNYNQLKKNVEQRIKEIKDVNKKAKILFLGGNHSITPAIVKTLEPKSYLVLDAHFDLINDYDNYEKNKGSKNSHACSTRRIYEHVKDIQIRGVRSGAKEEHEFSKKLDWRSDLKKIKKNRDYVSIDVDVLDPVYIDTGTPEMFGFKPEEVIEIIRKTNFRYIDINEWIPDQGSPYILQFIKEILKK